jgi:hypothetical protein
VSEAPKTRDITVESHVRELDAADGLAPFRDRFHQLPGAIYLNGSLRLCRGF